MSEDCTRVTAAGTGGSSAQGADLTPGLPVGSYVVSGLIAAGGCGSVYRARHAILGRSVAIKVLRKDFAGAHPMARRFLLEAMAVNTIRHPNIVDIFDMGDLPDGRPYYVMEFLEGGDLDQHVKQHGRMPLAEAVAVLDPVCSALEAAHAAGFVHRDIKASNVHLGRDGSGRPIVKLLDFGVAKALHPEAAVGGLTQVGSRIGSSSTMAPEQILGAEITPQTDVYSLGVLLFKLLSGRNPFVADDPRDLDQLHLKAPPPRASDVAPVPPAVDAVIARAMAKAPRERHASAAAFLQDARAALAEVPVAPATAEAPALGLYIEARVAEDEPDPDGAFERAMAVMDLVEPALTDAGFAIALRGGTSFLGVKVLSASPGDDVRSGVQAVDRLLADLRSSGTGAGLQLVAALHAAGILCGASGADESATGPLMSIGDWVPATSEPWVLHQTQATRAFAA